MNETFKVIKDQFEYKDTLKYVYDLIKREIKGRLKKTIGFLLIKIFLQDQIKVNIETAKPKMSIRDTIL